MSGTDRQSARMAKILSRPAVVAQVAELPDDERRWARRKQSRTPAMMWYEGAPTMHSCVIKDTSSTGALIEMVKSKMNPDASTGVVRERFTLIIAMDKVRIDCKVAWRGENEIGVRYVSPARPMEPRVRR